MPTMGVTTNPTTTSSSTWIRCLIANHILMLMIKVTKNNLDVIFETYHGTTIMEEEIPNMIKMKKVIMDIIKNFHNLVKIAANTIIAHEVKQAFKCNANPMIWLAAEDLLTGPQQVAREEGMRPRQRNLEDEEKVEKTLSFVCMIQVFHLWSQGC
jgi:hypothetical protein